MHDRTVQVLALLAAALGLAAVLAPGPFLAPFGPGLAALRAPAAAPGYVRMLGIALLAAGTLLALGWKVLQPAWARAYAALAGMDGRAFGGLAAGLALAPRLALMLAVPYRPASDAAWYAAAAGALARGEGFVLDGHATAYRPPGYPFLLSLFFRVFGAHPAWAGVLGLLATGLILLLLHRVASRLHGTGPARLAVLGVALYPALVAATPQALSELPFLAGTLLLAVLLLEAPAGRALPSLAAGTLVGLLVLVRGAGLALLPLVPLTGWLRGRRWGPATGAGLLAVLACAAVLAPWAARNARVLGRATLGTNVGLNLAIGNHPGASGGWEPAPALAAGPERGPGGEAEADAAHRRAALAFLRERPGEALALLPRKLLHFVLLETSAVTALFLEAPGPRGLKAALLVLSQGAWVLLAFLLLLRAAGWTETARRPRGVQLLSWGVAGAFTALSLVFFGDDRFRMALLPWLLMEGAVAAAALADG